MLWACFLTMSCSAFTVDDLDDLMTIGLYSGVEMVLPPEDILRAFSEVHNMLFRLSGTTSAREQQQNSELSVTRRSSSSRIGVWRRLENTGSGAGKWQKRHHP
jgi:hypothetical protein